MRRSPLLLLLSAILFCADVSAQTPPAQPTQAASSGTLGAESERLRETARTLLRSGSPDDTEKAADLLVKASQIDAGSAEIQKDIAERKNLEKAPGDSWKSIAAPLTSLITTLILAGTLVFNIYQGRLTEKDKLRDRLLQQDADERKRLVDALGIIQKSENISPVAALINTFTTEPYRADARRMGRTVLMRMKNYDEFTDLFTSVFEPLTIASLAGVLQLLRAVDTTLNPMLLKISTGGEDRSALDAAEQEQYKLLMSERKYLSEKLAACLRQPGRQELTELDLSLLGIEYANFQGVDLSKAIVRYSSWASLNLDDADLRGIQEFQGLVVYNTAWWHAAFIDAPLLEYLSSKYPYTNQTGYSLSAEEYTSNLQRLHKQSAPIVVATSVVETASERHVIT